MDRPPRITIITPSFNQSKYLEKTIQSVLEQDYPDLEYIVLDGGSTDGSVEIIKKYADRIAFWESRPDHGQSDAINKGFRRATGDIVSWINSDDVYAKGAFARVAGYFADHPDDDMVYGDCDLINEDGEMYARERPGLFDLARFLERNYIPQPTVFLRRTSIEGDHLVDESFHYAMDYELWLRISGKHNIGYLPVTLARFRYHRASKTTAQIDKFAFERFLILRDFIKRCDDRYQRTIPKQLIRELTQINGEKIVAAIDALQADAGTSLLTEDDRRYLSRIVNGDPVPVAEVRHVCDVVGQVYTGYFRRLSLISPEETGVVRSIFLHQLVTIAATEFTVDPRRSSRLALTLLTVRPRLLLDRRFNKLLVRVLITPSGDRLLTSLKSKAVTAYLKCRILQYKLVP
jgi:glycosyltransferase involved in cell wall biosynthesis